MTLDAGRILAPAWVSLSLGIALLIQIGLINSRGAVLRAAAWATRPEPRWS